MEMKEHEDIEKHEREILIWLKMREIPIEHYHRLQGYLKTILHKRVCPLCPSSRTASDAQLRELYKELRLEKGRRSIDPTDFMPSQNQNLEKFFSPLSPSEKLPYLYKF